MYERIRLVVDDVTYIVRRPTEGELAAGRQVYRKAYRRAVSAGAVRRAHLDRRLRERGEWDDDRQAEADRLLAAIDQAEALLATEDAPLSDRRAAALSLRDLRRQRQALLQPYSLADEATADAVATDAQFDSLVAACLLRDDGTRVFKDADDYQQHKCEPHAFRGAAVLASLLVPGVKPDWERHLPETVFLAEHGE